MKFTNGLRIESNKYEEIEFKEREGDIFPDEALKIKNEIMERIFMLLKQEHVRLKKN